MAQQTNAQVVAAQLERVVDKIEVLYERGDDTLQAIQKANDVKMVSTRAMRIVLQVTAGGNGGYYDPDGGDLGVGSGESYDVATLTPVFTKMSFQMTSLAQWATDSDEKAIIDETNRIVSEGMLQYRSFLDKQVNATPAASLGTITVVAGTTLTFAVPTGAQLFYEGQQIQFYDTTVTNNKSQTAGMVSTVLIVDPITTQTVVFDQVPGTVIPTDLALPAGLIGANPTGIFSIKYHQNNAQTGVWQNLNRATYPVKLQTPRVNGNNGALVPMQPWLAVNKIKKSLGLNKVGKLIAHMAVEQSQAWNQLATTVQIIDRSRRETGEGQDMNLRSYESGAGNMCGIPIKEAQNADQARIDFLDLSVWGRAVMNNLGFYKGANGKVWFQIYGASGGIATAMQFHYVYNFQIFNRNPRRGAFVDTLARPAGF
jgi:hypothetical protein